MRLTAKIDTSIVPVDQTDYIGGIEYRNGDIQAIYHPEGRAVPNGSSSPEADERLAARIRHHRSPGQYPSAIQ